MLFFGLQNVPPAALVRFLREHRSEWADFNVDAYAAASVKASPYGYPGMRPTRFTGSQIIMPLGQTIEHEEVTFCAYHFIPLVMSIMLNNSLYEFLKLYRCLKLLDSKVMHLVKKILLCREIFISYRYLFCFVKGKFISVFN